MQNEQHIHCPHNR